MSHVHIIGAGLAGLSAAIELTDAGRQVTLYETGPAAGGRCRSYFDKELDLTIDNGNHLLLSGNRSAFDYIRKIGALDLMAGPNRPLFPFADLKTGERWSVRPNKGRIPWWVFSKARRVPGTKLSDYREFAAIARIKDDTVVGESMRRGRLYWKLLEPLSIAALNTRPQAGLARLLGAVMRETLLRGGKACIPSFPAEGLSEALIDPAIKLLTERGATIHFNRRVSALTLSNDRVNAIHTGDAAIPIPAGDSVVLAVPPWVAADLLPGLVAPDAFEAIVNLHFKIDVVPEGDVAETGFLGVIDGTAEWIFIKPGYVSVTISAANGIVDDPSRAIAATVWPNVRAALNLPGSPDAALPPFRVIKEKRATFAATAVQELRRPPARTDWLNLALAGDWTRTGLPATIEGAIRSGVTAAKAILSA